MYEESYHDKDISQFRFLVTGGAGFIGSNIVEYLLKYGAGKVRVLDDLSTGSMENIKPFLSNPAFEFVKGDICDFETCRAAVRNIDFISHQAALGSVPRSINNPIRTNEVNVTGFLNVLTAAKEADIRKMVYAASSSTYGDHPALPKVEETIGNPLSPYAVTKYVNELYAAVFSKVYGFHAIGLRYFNVFGPRQNPKGAYAAVIPLFVMAALQNEAPAINGDGQTSRDFTFIRNVVQANMRALFAEHVQQHEVCNIAAGQQVTLNQLWQTVQDLVGTAIEPHYKPERRGDVKHSLAAITKANKLLGYQPDTLFEEGLQIAIKWYRKQLVEKATNKIKELHG